MTGQRHRRPDGLDQPDYYIDLANNSSYLGPAEAIAAGGCYSNLSVNSVWDLTDITYVLEGTLILAGAYDFDDFFETGPLNDAPVPNLNAYATEPPPVASLTIQAALPGTLLADGETIPSPGQSVIVKLYNDNTPNDAGLGQSGVELRLDGHPGRPERRGGLRRRRRRRRRSCPATARSSIPVRTPSSASWASRATRRPASSAYR